MTSKNNWVNETMQAMMEVLDLLEGKETTDAIQDALCILEEQIQQEG